VPRLWLSGARQPTSFSYDTLTYRTRDWPIGGGEAKPRLRLLLGLWKQESYAFYYYVEQLCAVNSEPVAGLRLVTRFRRRSRRIQYRPVWWGSRWFPFYSTVLSLLSHLVFPNSTCVGMDVSTSSGSLDAGSWAAECVARSLGYLSMFTSQLCCGVQRTLQKNATPPITLSPRSIHPRR
jgi:hypothetical protein